MAISASTQNAGPRTRPGSGRRRVFNQVTQERLGDSTGTFVCVSFEAGLVAVKATRLLVGLMEQMPVGRGRRSG